MRYNLCVLSIIQYNIFGKIILSLVAKIVFSSINDQLHYVKYLLFPKQYHKLRFTIQKHGYIELEVNKDHIAQNFHCNG